MIALVFEVEGEPSFSFKDCSLFFIEVKTRALIKSNQYTSDTRDDKRQNFKLCWTQLNDNPRLTAQTKLELIEVYKTRVPVRG